MSASASFTTIFQKNRLPMLADRRSLLRCAALGAAAIAVPAWSEELSSPSPSLDVLARRKGLRFGSALAADHLDDPAFCRLLTHECSVLVAENEFKWKRLEPRPGVFQSGPATRIADFAQHSSMELRGHCFIWNQDNRIPQWMLEREDELGADNGACLVEAMQQHADRLVEAFPGVRSWDAVNESVQLGDGSIRNSLLSRILGERHIDLGFEIMRERAPEAQLVYNDYMSWDSNRHHRDGVLRMLEAALGRGVPINALGIQSHLGSTYGRQNEASWRAFLEAVEGMGLAVLITELDCSDRYVEARSVAERDAEVAAFTKGYLDLTLSFKNVQQVLTWGISDRDSYLNRPAYPEERRREDGLPMRGHPYDDKLGPKPLRAAIAAALAGAPRRPARA